MVEEPIENTSQDFIIGNRLAFCWSMRSATVPVVQT